MGIKKSEFFKEKRFWSNIKDNILGFYLKPYITKIKNTKKPTKIIDCFAGPGKFEDNKDGSPLIINKLVEKLGYNIETIFIEKDKKYYDSLRNSTKEYSFSKSYYGKFSEIITEIVSKLTDHNVFIYIDPFGTKDIKYDLISKITNKYNFYSIEMLMNFNSQGFLRNGCKILKMSNENFNENIDYDNFDEDNPQEESVNRTLGNDKWKNILNDYYNKKYNFIEAEKRLVYEYKEQLRQIFKYVIDVPIKKKINHLPTYRLIFGTNHPDGLILMNENMNKKWKNFIENECGGQLSLFYENYYKVNNPINSNIDIKKRIFDLIKEKKTKIEFKELLVELIKEYELLYSVKEYRNILKEMESNNEILVERTPKYTKNNKPTKFWDYNKSIKISLLR